MIAFNKYLCQYLNEVRRLLPYNRRRKAQIVADIKNSIRLFLAENPDADYNVITQRFGHPETVASSYVEEMEGTEILRSIKAKRNILTIIASGVAVILLLWSITVVAAFVKYVDGYNGYFDIEVETVEEIVN